VQHNKATTAAAPFGGLEGNELGKCLTFLFHDDISGGKFPVNFRRKKLQEKGSASFEQKRFGRQTLTRSLF
jgi:hypothetical protein